MVVLIVKSSIGRIKTKAQKHNRSGNEIMQKAVHDVRIVRQHTCQQHRIYQTYNAHYHGADKIDCRVFRRFVQSKELLLYQSQIGYPLMIKLLFN